MRSMFSSTSARRKSGLSEGNFAILGDRAAQALLANRLNNDVDRPLQNCFKAMRERVNSAEIGKS